MAEGHNQKYGWCRLFLKDERVPGLSYGCLVTAWRKDTTGNTGGPSATDSHGKAGVDVAGERVSPLSDGRGPSYLTLSKNSESEYLLSKYTFTGKSVTWSTVQNRIIID